MCSFLCFTTVSYTHLDVYKRQTYDEEGHRFAEYGICCKTGSTDVKIRDITLEKSEINELLALSLIHILSALLPAKRVQ